MEAMTTNYTAQDWAEHEHFVQMFRAAKQRKREWQAKMEVVLAEKAEKIRAVRLKNGLKGQQMSAQGSALGKCDGRKTP